MLSKLYGWKKINLEDIYENVKEYQKNFVELEPNSVYSSRIHFSANEFKDLMNNNKKGEKKPENFYSKIIFMLDYLGVKLDKKKTFEEHMKDKKYNEDKIYHLLDKIRKQKEDEENEQKKNEEENLINEIPQQELNAINENNLENKLNIEGVNTEIKSDQILEKPVEEVDPFPEEEDYYIEDLRSDEFYYAFNEDGTYPRPGGFIVINHPNNQEEIDKLFEFNITFDKVIYLVDQSEEQPKELALRRIPNL
jgi:hypothetical protein